MLQQIVHSRVVKIHMDCTCPSERGIKAIALKIIAARASSSLRPWCFRTHDSHYVLRGVCGGSPIRQTARSHLALLVPLRGLRPEALNFRCCHNKMRSIKRRITSTTSLPYFSISVCKVLDVHLQVRCMPLIVLPQSKYFSCSTFIYI
jgi:hypothetical protein